MDIDEPPEFETVEQQRERLHASIRSELLDRQFSNSEAYDKAILTLSSGFLILSLTFIKEILPTESMKDVAFLYISWASLALAIIFTVTSFRVSNYAIDKQLKRAERYYKHHDDKAFQPTCMAFWVELINIASGVLFVSGVVLTVAFVFQNFPEAKIVSKKPGNEQTRLDEGHNVVPLQQVTPDPTTRGQPVPQMQQVKPSTPPAASPGASPASAPQPQSSEKQPPPIKK